VLFVKLNGGGKIDMKNKQTEREAFFDLYKKAKEEQKEKEQNKDWMYQQRERNELGADYFSYQGYHPPKN
jgi:formylmethanofuran dehydrogenase subunit E